MMAFRYEGHHGYSMSRRSYARAYLTSVSPFSKRKARFACDTIYSKRVVYIRIFFVVIEARQPADV